MFRKLVAFGLGLAILLSVSQARAGVIGITDSSSLGSGADSLNWGTLGADYSEHSSPITITSSGGEVVTVSQPVSAASPDFERRDQSGSTDETGWNGNFSPGTQLLWYPGGGAVTIDFGNNPVSGAGMQIQTDSYGSFTAQIQAFDSNNNLLGTFTEAGNSNSNADGSAIFLGVLGTNGTNIDRLVISTPSGNFAIGPVTLAPAFAAPAVPEPGSFLLWSAVGLVGLCYTRRKLQRKLAV